MKLFIQAIIFVAMIFMAFASLSRAPPDPGKQRKYFEPETNFAFKNYFID